MHMKMKRYIAVPVITLLLSLPAFVACDGWLEATSSSQVSDKKLFSSRSGFHEALSGVYLTMAKTEAYGGDYTWRINDLVCVPYASQSNTFFRAFQQQNYTTSVAVPYLEQMWQGGYNIIANANKVLQELENGRSVVTDDYEYNLIKGELLGIRAYVHFDLLRMFGPATWAGDNASKLVVPYVRSYGSDPEVQRTAAETAVLLLEDIQEALKCLEADPVRGDVPERFETTINTDGYWTDRQRHLNYYAVEALAARVAMWAGSFAQAYSLAEDVARNAVADGLVSWLDAEALVQESTADFRDWTFSTEHLFSLDVTNLYDNCKDYFFPSSNSMSSGYILPREIVESLFSYFPEAGWYDLNEDVRGPACQMSYLSEGYTEGKFYGSSGYKTHLRCRMPMIRLSEMYYIMAEVRAASFDYGGAAALLDEVRSHRGISRSLTEGPIARIDLSLPSEFVQANFLDVLDDEYLTEFIGEGQYYPYLRRMWGQRRHAVSFGTLGPLNKVYPYPNEEIVYGRKQEL